MVIPKTVGLSIVDFMFDGNGILRSSNVIPLEDIDCDEVQFLSILPIADGIYQMPDIPDGLQFWLWKLWPK